MSGNKDFKKRRREDEMDDREQKRRRPDQQDRDRSRSYNNSSSVNQNRYNSSNNNIHSYNSNKRNASNNYTDRNNNSGPAPNKNNRPQYRVKDSPDNNRIFDKKPKKIPIHLVSRDRPSELKMTNKTLHFNFANNNVNGPKQVPPSAPKPKVSSAPAPANTAADPAPPLPGYYYDPDVNRYFKLPPSGTVMYKKYQEVLKKAAEKERKQQEETKEREEKERMERGVTISILSSKYKSPLSTIVRREAGRSQTKEFTT